MMQDLIGEFRKSQREKRPIYGELNEREMAGFYLWSYEEKAAERVGRAIEREPMSLAERAFWQACEALAEEALLIERIVGSEGEPVWSKAMAHKKADGIEEIVRANAEEIEKLAAQIAHLQEANADFERLLSAPPAPAFSSVEKIRAVKVFENGWISEEEEMEGVNWQRILLEIQTEVGSFEAVLERDENIDRSWSRPGTIHFRLRAPQMPRSSRKKLKKMLEIKLKRDAGEVCKVSAEPEDEWTAGEEMNALVAQTVFETKIIRATREKPVSETENGELREDGIWIDTGKTLRAEGYHRVCSRIPMVRQLPDYSRDMNEAKKAEKAVRDAGLGLEFEQAAAEEGESCPLAVCIAAVKAARRADAPVLERMFSFGPEDAATQAKPAFDGEFDFESFFPDNTTT